MAVFAVAVAPDDIIKYQSFVYGSFAWEIHVRYNNSVYTSNKLGVASASYKQGTAGEVNTYSTLARLEETEHANEINRISKIIPYKSGVFLGHRQTVHTQIRRRM